ncbi:hypothetical protein [Herpetosiphon gulosus]|uniref:Uncharacterized protein n=1 Tax=Herpetosiphon gulosus TaxID=1973496 RepID=A0ABP9X1L3_9CHLR
MPVHNDLEDTTVDMLFRDALKQELTHSAPKVSLPQRIKSAPSYEPRLRGGGPGGQPCSSFYLLFYVMNSSRASWSIMPA